MMRLTLFYFAFQKENFDSFSILFLEKFQRSEIKMSEDIHKLVEKEDFKGVERALEVNANLVRKTNWVG